MYKVVFEYDDGTTDEIYTDSITEAEEYATDDNFSHIEII